MIELAVVLLLAAPPAQDEVLARARRHVAAAELLAGQKPGDSLAQSAAAQRALQGLPESNAKASLSCRLAAIVASKGMRAAQPASCGDAAESQKADPLQHLKDLTESQPVFARLALQRYLARALPAGAPAVAQWDQGSLRSTLRSAKRIAALIDPDAARVVLQVAKCSIAERTARAASEALAGGKSRDAAALAYDATLLDPGFSAASALLKEALALRQNQLRVRARKLHGQPLAALGLLLGAELLDKKEPDPALFSALRSATVRSVVVRDLGPKSAIEDFPQRVMNRLSQKLNSLQVSGEGRGSVELVIQLSPVTATVEGRVEARSKKVLAYRFRQPNEHFREAVDAYNSAIDEVESARSSYDILHNAANEMANKASAGGPLAGLAGMFAVGEEGSGLALVIKSENALKEASRVLRSTPRLVEVSAEGEAHYPIMILSVHKEVNARWRLAGTGLDESIHVETVEAARMGQSIVGRSDLGVPGERVDINSLIQFEPDYDDLAERIAQQASQSVAAALEAALWESLTTAREPAEVAASAAAYWTRGKDAEKRATAAEVLRWKVF